ncbi:hypothetical protein AVDCRST_MAG84-515 [uncultured Microcoleus sp.]|uniref:Uncharacterized protein n=1 Tax=uncultured Microcoleus sp. TaxID=259945 RepID=A0A6J4KJ20_9CYAN|nr:hypothetical protein AVDCRST_MAG84-515 [uncultured Microcoleus sp.]
MKGRVLCKVQVFLWKIINKFIGSRRVATSTALNKLSGILRCIFRAGGTPHKDFIKLDCKI